jgi:hypothetical protein
MKQTGWMATMALVGAMVVLTGCRDPLIHTTEPNDTSDGSDTVETKPDTATMPDTVETSPDTADPDPDTGSMCADGQMRNPITGECVVADTGPEPDTGVPPDTAPDASPDTGPTYPDVGQSFNGPTMTGSSDVATEQDYGVGLYWQYALMEAQRGPHQHVPNSPLVTLAKVRSQTGDKAPIWKLPKAPPEKRHFYQNYCEMVGHQECAKRGINDDEATFAIIMLGIHRAPRGGSKASDCTFGMIHRKTSCNYGRSVAPSPTQALIYAYRSFDTSNYPFFDQIGISQRIVQPGYHFLLLPQKDAGQTSDIFPGTQMGVIFSSKEMFPMLYP